MSPSAARWPPPPGTPPCRTRAGARAGAASGPVPPGFPTAGGCQGFGQNPIPIREEYLDNLFNTQQAPGYIPGSGTYNQFRLNDPGLFGALPGQAGEVNLRYGLGGTGDPTTGHEVQTPERWITGNPASSAQAMQGDPYARGVRPLPGR